MKFKKIIKNEEARTIIFLFISLMGLILSFLNISIGMFDFAWIAIILCGIPIIKEAIVGLVTKFDIKADVLVSMALIASILIGEILAAGEIAFIMAIGGLLEEYTVNKSKSGIEKLIDLSPRTARIIKKWKENVGDEKDGETIEKIIPAKDVKIGEIIKVLPGETIPVDATIINGETSIDQSVMTGEPMPIDKTIGDDVFSGTINQFGSIIIKSTKSGKDSSLQRMVKLVESADAEKAKVVRQTDKWATWIVVIALTSAIITYIITGEILRSVTILVVFCPCALVLATPTAIVAAIGNLTKKGILVKEGDALERLAQVKNIIFDKTGTLTYGKPELIDLIPYSSEDTYETKHENELENKNKSFHSEKLEKKNKSQNKNELESKNELLKQIASLESKSEHPLGKAIVNYYKKTNGTKLLDVENFKMLIGKGIIGEIDNQTILAGNKKLLKEYNINTNPKWTEDKIAKFIENGSIIIYLAINNKFKGVIILSDILRKEAKTVINSVKNLDLNPLLVTGDNEKPAEYMAKELGIKKVFYNCLPEDKMEIIDNYQNKGKEIAMIGDGINDAPSLKKSFVGIAMGGIGSDITVEASDITLISDDIKYIPHLLGLSKKTMQTININISISLLLNFLAIILAILGILNPITGALVHNIGSVLVVIYSTLLLRWNN